MRRTKNKITWACFLMLTLVLAVIFAPKDISAATVDEETRWMYEIVDEEVTITGYSPLVDEETGDSIIPNDIVIPDMIEEYPVTILATNSLGRFKESTGYLVLPKSLRRIEDSVWNKSTSYRNSILISGELELPTTLEYIGSSAFINASNLKGNLVIPDNIVSIGSSAFYGCSGLTGNLDIPKGVSSIGSNAFYGCSGFTGDLIIPDNVLSIGERAFSRCSGFDGELILPDTLSVIEDNTFSQCSGLTGNLVLPNSLTMIGRYSFFECTGFSGDIIIPEGVTVINRGAFKGCTGFDGKLVLPSTLIRIGDQKEETDEDFNESDSEGVFYGCENLTGDIIIPDTVVVLGPGVFYGCKGFDGELKLSSSISVIQSSAFYGCSSLSGDIIIPDNVSEIETYAFYGTGFDGELVLPNDLCILGVEAFYGCSKLRGDLTIPNEIKILNERTFSGCRNLSGTLTLSKKLSIVEDNVFYGCSGLSGNLTLPDTITEIGDSAFYGCSGFEGELVLPSNIISVGNNAFCGCNFSGNLTIPVSMSSIGTNSFYCKNINKINNQSSIRFPLIELGGTDDRLWINTKDNEILTHTDGSVQNGTVVETIRKVMFNQEVLSLPEGTTAKLSVLYLPTILSEEIDTELEWSSNNKDIVRILEDNSIQTLKEGSAVITVKASSGVSATCILIVTKSSSSTDNPDDSDDSDDPNIPAIVPITGVSLNQNELKLEVGNSGKLIASVRPTNTTMSSQVIWKSSNTNVAIVDAQGNVAAIGVGSATIIATAENNVSGYCTVIVNAKPESEPSGGNTDNKPTETPQPTVPTYTIKYVLNRGTNNSANPTEYTSEVILQKPTRKGYVFNGWYKTAKFKGKISRISNQNITVYAKWTKVAVGKVSKLTLKRQSGKKLKVSYKTVKKANGYQIAYSTNKKFKGKTTKTIDLKGKSKVIKKLSKKIYYVRVRAFRYDSMNKKVYGKWSSVKQVKIK